ncbi:MAG: ABC transporter substrate-binding protein [Syntrophobacteraceae bacterium]|nr:ABC transporter substrate-binding protein [Syntrophobacteraceae bacterium]
MIPKHLQTITVWKDWIGRRSREMGKDLGGICIFSMGSPFLKGIRSLLVFLAVWTIMPMDVGAAPGRSAQTATSLVREVLDEAMNIQTRPDLEGETHRRERARLIRKLIGDNFLASDMARESLKGYWERMSQEQRTEFQKLFTTLFQDSYTRLVLNFLKKESVEYKEESPDQNGTLVRTLIMRANEHIPVDYHLVQKSGRWFIRDVDIDGVSIVQNYQSKFRQVIEKSSIQGLLQNMRTQSQAIED